MAMTASETMTTSKPIIMSGESVRAILAGVKRQTRRVCKPQPGLEENGDIHFPWATFYSNGLTHTWDDDGIGGENWQANDHPAENKFAEALKRTLAVKSVPWKVGQRLWVKETWCGYEGTKRGYFKADMSYWDHVKNKPVGCIGEPDKAKYQSPLFMPRWASRLTLEVTAVRVEKLQEISHHDALAEGIAYDVSKPDGSPLARFQKVWDKLNGKTNPWNTNPYVWVISFQPLQESPVSSESERQGEGMEGS